MDAVLLLVSFAVILAGALLFTNAVEWIGHRLNLGEGAVGSLLAAVGTAMPETLIAIVGTVEGGDQVAIGSIVGGAHLFVEDLLSIARASGSSRWYLLRWRPSCRMAHRAPPLLLYKN